MPLDFIHYVESALGRLEAGGWLNVAAVQGLTDIDFVTLPPARREELFRRVEQFRDVARLPQPDAGQRAVAREALTRIGELLHPYRTPESRRVLDTLWGAWQEEAVRDVRQWIPTFDYQLGEDSSGEPAVWVWLILNDDVDIEAADTRGGLSRLRLLIHARFQDAGIDRWPYIGVRSCSDVRELTARVHA